MKITVIISGVIVSILILFIIYRLIAFRKESMRNSKLKYFRIQPLLSKLEAGEAVTTEEIESLAQQPIIRQDVYYLLQDFGKVDLFPQSLYTIEKAAESSLVSWLEFPTELDAIPDQIQYMQTVKVEDENEQLDYLVFKFKTQEPHWAAKEGWMLGVVGPYTATSKPFDFPVATFSRLSKLQEVTPEQEVAWVDVNFRKR